jgi:hypothetical protein
MKQTRNPGGKTVVGASVVTKNYFAPLWAMKVDEEKNRKGAGVGDPQSAAKITT